MLSFCVRLKIFMTSFPLNQNLKSYFIYSKGWRAFPLRLFLKKACQFRNKSCVFRFKIFRRRIAALKKNNLHRSNCRPHRSKEDVSRALHGAPFPLDIYVIFEGIACIPFQKPLNKPAGFIMNHFIFSQNLPPVGCSESPQSRQTPDWPAPRIAPFCPRRAWATDPSAQS